MSKMSKMNNWSLGVKMILSASLLVIVVVGVLTSISLDHSRDIVREQFKLRTNLVGDYVVHDLELLLMTVRRHAGKQASDRQCGATRQCGARLGGGQRKRYSGRFSTIRF